jgi:phosphatidylglycerophosphate synthase
MLAVLTRLLQLEAAYFMAWWVPDWTCTPANVVTLNRFRIGLWCLHVGYWGHVWFGGQWWGHVMVWPFVLAVLADKLDGLLAKRYGKSEFGKLADPLVDGTLVINGLSLTAYHFGTVELIGLTLAVAFIGFYIWILRIRYGTETTEWAKWGYAIMGFTTMVLLAGVALDFAAHPAGKMLVEYGTWSLWGATAWFAVNAIKYRVQVNVGIRAIGFRGLF